MRVTAKNQAVIVDEKANAREPLREKSPTEAVR